MFRVANADVINKDTGLKSFNCCLCNHTAYGEDDFQKHLIFSHSIDTFNNFMIYYPSNNIISTSYDVFILHNLKDS